MHPPCRLLDRRKSTSTAAVAAVLAWAAKVVRAAKQAGGVVARVATEARVTQGDREDAAVKMAVRAAPSAKRTV